MWNEFISGGIAGSVSVIAGQPLDTIKVKLQTSIEHNGIIDCARGIVRKEGFAGLFRGMLPPIVTATLQNAVVFMTHEFTLSHIQSGIEDGEESYGHLFMSGAASGLVSAVVQCPTELIKIRLQLNSRKVYANTTDCVVKSYKAGGISALYQGMAVTTFREVPAFAFYFTSHKIVEDQLNGLNVLNPFAASFIAGGAAGAVSWSVCYPLDVAKTEIQMAAFTAAPEQKSFFKVLRRIYLDSGLKRLYRGIGATIVRSFPVNAVLFPTYKYISEFLNDRCNIKAGQR